MQSSSNGKKQPRKYFKPGELAQIRDSQITAKRNRVKPVSKFYLRRALELPLVFDISDQLELRMAEDCRGGAPFYLNRKKIVAIKPVNWFSNHNLEIPTTELTRDRPIIDSVDSVSLERLEV